MSGLADAYEREKFTTEIDRNFSVVASAGAGKTRAITDRIVAIAKGPRAVERLEELVVVTFTNRAADEMQHRALQRLLEARVAIDVIAAFNRAFFGTIHSFCMKLLREHGHRQGLPARFDLIIDDSELWAEFVERQTIVGAALSPEQRSRLFRFISVADLLALGKKLAGSETAIDPGLSPAPDCKALLAHAAAGRSAATIEASQASVREWLRRLEQSDDVVRWPESSCTAKAFVALWDVTFAPLRKWVRDAALVAGCEIARAWRDFRLERGAVNYDDQIALAVALVRDSEAGGAIRSKNYRIILDEAQDTAPGQFDVLLGAVPGGETHRPEPGHFCMVGDFQQCIYGGCAELGHYRGVHEAILASGGDSVQFSVTFRLDAEPISLVNAAFPSLFNGAGAQVDFVSLSPRMDVLPGQVVRIEVPGDPALAEEKKIAPKARHAARWLAGWIQSTGLKLLRAERWSEVAILCPRKSWFAPLKAALRAEGLEVQVQSEREIRGDSPAHAWLTALLHVIVEPEDGFEMVGVLREIFGIPDEALARYAEAGGKFVLGKHGPAPLAELASIRKKSLRLPLFSAVRHLVQATRLRDRLLSLPAEEYGDLGAELDEILVLAAEAESAGLTLTEFATQMRVDFDATREARATQPDAIQLITSHKAKGSEWQAVIVPALGRKVGDASPDYPQLFTVPGSSEIHIAFGKEDQGAELKEALKVAAMQQMERLLYVALTRAKHTLVLVDDRSLFDARGSQFDVLRARAQGVNAAAIAALKAEAAVSHETHAAQQSRLVQVIAEEHTAPLRTAPQDLTARASSASAGILKRNPSSLSDSTSPEADPTKIVEREELIGLQNEGAKYGTWWHGFVETFDWTQPLATWPEAIDPALAHCPNRDRGALEWNRFAGAATEDKALGSFLSGAHWRRYPEFPFIWALSDTECIEGIIDLAAHDTATGEWMILDWKTNSIASSGAEDLRAKYLPQLAAYWSALRAMLGVSVSAGIYSTACGLWLPYAEEELAEAWRNISRSSDELNAALTL